MSVAPRIQSTIALEKPSVSTAVLVHAALSTMAPGSTDFNTLKLPTSGNMKRTLAGVWFGRGLAAGGLERDNRAGEAGVAHSVGVEGERRFRLDGGLVGSEIEVFARTEPE